MVKSDLTISETNKVVYSITQGGKIKLNHYEQLFSELTPAEGANISGGTYYQYSIENNTDRVVSFNINGTQQYVPPKGEVVNYYDKRSVVVKYDAKIGRGIEEVTKSIRPGEYDFYRRNKDYLVLNPDNDGPVDNLKI